MPEMLGKIMELYDRANRIEAISGALASDEILNAARYSLYNQGHL